VRLAQIDLRRAAIGKHLVRSLGVVKREIAGESRADVTRTAVVCQGRDEAELAAKRARFPDFDGIAGTPEQVIAGLAAFAEVGSQYVTFHMPDAEDVAPLLLLGETVVPAAARL